MSISCKYILFKKNDYFYKKIRRVFLSKSYKKLITSQISGFQKSFKRHQIIHDL